MVKKPPANAGDIRDAASIPRLGRSPGEGNGNLFTIPAWEIPWTEKPGGTVHGATRNWTWLK